jgi:hypothetical protein
VDFPEELVARTIEELRREYTIVNYCPCVGCEKLIATRLREAAIRRLVELECEARRIMMSA